MTEEGARHRAPIRDGVRPSEMHIVPVVDDSAHEILGVGSKRRREDEVEEERKGGQDDGSAKGAHGEEPGDELLEREEDIDPEELKAEEERLRGRGVTRASAAWSALFREFCEQRLLRKNPDAWRRYCDVRFGLGGGLGDGHGEAVLQHQGEPVSHRCQPEPHMESEMMSVEKKWR